MFNIGNFIWIIDNKIGGMPKPDIFGNLWENLHELKNKYGIKTIVSLTEQDLDKNTLADMKMNYFHIPINDFTAPSLDQFEQFKKIYNNENFPMAVHCFAGMGRTGTILAAALVIEGFPPDEAIMIVRNKRPGSIENKDQEDSVYKFHTSLLHKKDK